MNKRSIVTRHPFTAPIIIPLMKYLWKIGYTSIIGTTTMIVIVIRILVAVCVVASAPAREAPEEVLLARLERELA